MNLFLFNANDSASTYGIGSYLKDLKELINALGSGDVNIRIVHLHSIRPEFEITKTNGVEIWYIPEVSNQKTFSGVVQKFEDYYHNVIYLLRQHIISAKNLVFHFNYNQSQFLAKNLKTVFDCKTVSTVHFLKWSLVLNGNLHRLLAIKSKPENQRTYFEQLIITTDEYESLLYKEVDFVIVLSDKTKNFLCNEYRLEPDKIVVIPNGIDDISHKTEIKKDALRKKWGITENEFIILFVGRLNEVKGLLFLLRAFRKVLEKIPNCRLMIVGGGYTQTYLKENQDINTKINFTGLLEKKELYELYQIADVGVMPSLFETFGYVAVEMMMFSLPMITTTAHGLTEITEDRISSLHVPLVEKPDRIEIDTDLLAEKIVYLLEHPDEAKRLARNARKRYEEYYSKEVFRNNMIRFYKSLFDE